MTSIRRERLCLYYQLVQEKLSSPDEAGYQVNLLLELMQTSRSELEDYEAVCSKENRNISEEFKRKVFEKDELKQILDIEVSIALTPEQWSKILEQILLVVLILGRWLLPKGAMSRDQFSQLMLVYTGLQFSWLSASICNFLLYRNGC